MRLEFKQINEILLTDAVSYLREWLPDGELCGNEYTSLNPTRYDNSKGSFNINIRSGVWEDFAIGEKGGDLISLYAYINGCEQGEALKRIKSEYSFGTGSPGRKTKPKMGNPAEEDGWELVQPVPDDAPAPPKKSKIGESLLDPDRVYEYKNSEGKTLCYVYRFEKDTGGKDIRPLTLWKDKEGKLAWKYKMIPGNRPLYGLDVLSKYLTKPVLVVSGEKCVEAVRYYFSQKYSKEVDYPFVPVTWPNGDKSIDKADFRPLRQREIYYWPDNDESGRNAMLSISIKYNGTILEFERKEKDDGWDVADLVMENLENAEFDLAKYIRSEIEKQNQKSVKMNTPVPLSLFPHKTSKDKLLSMLENLEAMFGFYKMKINYNVITKKIEYKINNIDYDSPDATNDFYAKVKSLCSLNGFPKGDVKDFLPYLANQNSINPVLEWIRSKKTTVFSAIGLHFSGR